MKLGFSMVLGFLLAGTGLVSSPPFIKSVDNAQKPRTDPFGDPLPEGAVARLGTLRFRQGYYYVFSPDGKTMACAYGAKIRLLDSETGKDVLLGRGHESGVRCLAWSNDGKIIASGAWGVDKTIRLWDPVTMKELRRCQWDTGKAPYTSWGVEQIIFSLDGKTLIARGVDHTIRQFDTLTTKEIRRFGGFQGRLGEIALARDGKTIAALVYLDKKEFGWGPCQVIVWEVATGKELRSWQFPDDVGLQVFSPDLKFLVTHLRNGEDGLKLWNVATGKIIRTLPIRGWGVAFSPDGKRLMAQMGKTLSFWEPGSGKELRRVTINHEPYVFSKFAYCPDGKTLMSCDFWSHPRFWDAASGKEVKRFEGHDAPIVGLAFSPDGKQLASVAGQEIHLWEIAGQKEIRRFNGQVSVLQGVAFSADGRNLMSVSANHAIQIWDVASGKESRRGDQLGIIGAAAFSADRNTVALWREKNLSLWDMRTLKILREWNSSLDWNDTVAFSPDGKSLAAGGCGLIPDRDGQLLVGPDGKPKDYAIHLWDFTGRPLPRIGKHRRVVSWVTFSPDGRTLASVTWDNTIHLWEKASGLLRARWKTGDNVTTVRFSPNGRILASTNIGNYAGGHKTSPDEDWDKVRLWNVASGKEVHRFVGHRGTIQTLAFSPNGRLLASGSDDTTALVWDMEPVYRKVQTEPVQLKQGRLKELWADLSGSDGEKGYQALWTLAAASDQCLPVLQGHVRPVPFADPEQVARLVADLDSNQFATRQKAHRELEKLGVSAKPALRKSLTNKSSEEMRRRVQKLLDAPERDLPIVALRAVELLEHIGTAPARKILQSVTGGVPEAYLTQEAAASLKRLQSQK